MRASAIARREAKVSDRPTYTGKPCHSCGTLERYVSNRSCVSCTREARRQARRERPRKSAVRQFNDVL
jgi:hypothetical protein